MRGETGMSIVYYGHTEVNEEQFGYQGDELFYQGYHQERVYGTKALFNVARIYMQQGNTQLAQATFAQVADYDPSSEYGMLAKNLANVL